MRLGPVQTVRTSIFLQLVLLALLVPPLFYYTVLFVPMLFSYSSHLYFMCYPTLPVLLTCLFSTTISACTYF